MKHRFFHAFKVDAMIDAVVEALARGEYVTVAGSSDRFMRELTNRKVELDPVFVLGNDIYKEDAVKEVIEQANTADARTLLVLLDHGNRTPNLTTILAATEVTIISATFNRRKLKESPIPGEEVWEKHSDVDWLYGKPTLPNFATLTDEQHSRFVRDNTRSLDALFPVYDVVVDSIDLNAFISKPIPARAPLVSLDGIPMFFAESINEEFAYRGTGKTLWTMSLGLHLAAGKNFVNFEIPSAVKVAYVEGELPQAQLQDRSIKLSAGLEIPSGNFTLIARSRLPKGASLDITTDAGRAVIEDRVELCEASVLILDSLKSLGVKTTMDPLVIADLNQWFMRLRCKGLCVIFLHQAGVSGAQRGLSDLEDTLDVSMKLEKRGYSKGASFWMSFTKQREEGKLPEHGYACESGVWKLYEKAAIPTATKPKPLSKEDQVRERLKSGQTYDQIQEELEVSRDTISKIKKEMSTTHDDQSEAACQ